VSQRTIRRALREVCYQNRVIKKAIRLRVPNRRNRQAWCRGQLHFPVIGYWDRVIFSDESIVEIGANKRVYVWRKAREERKPECMNTPPRKKFGIMVWGCISYKGMGTLAFVKGNLNAHGYQDILEKNMWPVAAKYFLPNDFTFQDDHRSRIRILRIFSFLKFNEFVRLKKNHQKKS